MYIRLNQNSKSLENERLYQMEEINGNETEVLGGIPKS